MPTAAEVMQELEVLGSAQTVKTYRRHGVGTHVGVFGVSYADLGRLKKRLKTNQALARDLWTTRNHDARALAMMIVDPAETTSDEVEAWLRDSDYYGMTTPVAQIAAQMPQAVERAARWAADENEWIARAGWQVVEALALATNDLPDSYFEGLLPQIEAGIHGAKNRVSAAMNDAVIAIGVRNEALRQRAAEAAARIGKVYVDHGDTACKTPDATSYIEKIWARRGQRVK